MTIKRFRHSRDEWHLVHSDRFDGSVKSAGSDGEGAWLDRAAGVDGATLGEGGAVSVIEMVRRSGRCVGERDGWLRCSCASNDDACGNGEGVHGEIVGDVGF